MLCRYWSTRPRIRGPRRPCSPVWPISSTGTGTGGGGRGGGILSTHSETLPTIILVLLGWSELANFGSEKWLSMWMKDWLFYMLINTVPDNLQFCVNKILFPLSLFTVNCRCFGISCNINYRNILSNIYFYFLVLSPRRGKWGPSPRKNLLQDSEKRRLSLTIICSR